MTADPRAAGSAEPAPARRWLAALAGFAGYWLLAFLPNLPSGGSLTWRAVGTAAFAALMSALDHYFPQFALHRLAGRVNRLWRGSS